MGVLDTLIDNSEISTSVVAGGLTTSAVLFARRGADNQNIMGAVGLGAAAGFVNFILFRFVAKQTVAELEAIAEEVTAGNYGANKAQRYARAYQNSQIERLRQNQRNVTGVADEAGFDSTGLGSRGIKIQRTGIDTRPELSRLRRLGFV